MLPFLLVLLAAQGVFGAPSVSLTAYDINEIAPPSDNGQLDYLTNSAFELLDGGNTPVHVLAAQQVASDLASRSDVYSQALGVAHAIALIGGMGTGLPGDACACANLVDAYVSGNQGAVRQALGNYLSSLDSNIDTIAQLATNPESLRYTSGGRGSCPGGGRSYQFEAAWNKIFATANPYQISLVNEQYCTARRLYTSYNVESNNLAAAITAASIGPVRDVYTAALGPVSNFLRAAATGGNVAAAAASAKAAIHNAAGM